MPGSRVGWPRGSTLVGVGEDCFVMLIDGIVVACPPVRGLRRVVFLVTLAPLRTLEISFCCGRRSSSSATATPRSCSAAATLRPCRSGGSRPWCGRRVRLVHPRATTTAARVSRNGPNDCRCPAILQPCFHSRGRNVILRIRGHGRSEKATPPPPQKGDAMTSHPCCLFGDHLLVTVAEG